MKTKTINNFTVPENFEEAIENFQTKRKDKRNKKPLITQSKLFLEVASVIGKVMALEELTKAYIKYKDIDCFYWDRGLCDAFAWMDTVQGHNFWNEIHIKVMSDD